MLVRHQRAIIGYVGGLILATALISGGLNLKNMLIVATSLVGILIAGFAFWYAYRR